MKETMASVFEIIRKYETPNATKLIIIVPRTAATNAAIVENFPPDLVWKKLKYK